LARRIVSTGERMHHLVIDLLDFTRTRLGGRIPITRRSADLEHTVRTVANEFVTAHPTRDVRVDVAGDLHGQWDDQRVGQAVGNLLGNAVHHGSENTPIKVTARGDDTEVAIAVHNEGPAIPKEKQAHIFDPLGGVSRRGEPAKRDRQHLGLGLFITKAIVAAHNGRIEVDSSTDAGTEFTMHLPRVD
jgi:signal transduction histidine kinase